MKRILTLSAAILAVVLNAYSIDDGSYVICSALDRNYCIDNDHSRTNNGNNIQLWERNGSDAQIWQVVNVDGYAGIISEVEDNTVDVYDPATYPMLDLCNSRVANGTNIHLWRFNRTAAQKWIIVKNSDGTYTIKSSINGNYVIDLSNSEVRNGSNIQLYQSNGTKAQRWYFVRVQ